MQFDHFKMLPKSKLDRVKELYHALSIIKDSFELLKKNHYYQIQILYGQLRALLTDNKTIPLLLEIENILDHQVNIHYMPFDEENFPVIDSLALRVDSLPISKHEVLPGQRSMKIREFIKQNVIHYKSRDFNIEEIIKVVANKYGGAHYSKDAPKYFYELLNYGFNGQSLVDNLIIQLAEVTFHSGIELMKKISDFDFYFRLYLPEHPIGPEKFLFDFSAKGTPTRLQLLYHQKTYRFVLHDSFGNIYQLPFGRTITPNEFYLINFSHELTYDYASVFKLYVNETLFFEKRSEQPVFFINEFKHCQMIINGIKEAVSQDFEFGFGTIANYGRVLNHIEKIEMFNYFQEQDENQVRWLSSNTNGTKSYRSSQIKWSEGTEIRTIKK